MEVSSEPSQISNSAQRSYTQESKITLPKSSQIAEEPQLEGNCMNESENEDSLSIIEENKKEEEDEEAKDFAKTDIPLTQDPV